MRTRFLPLVLILGLLALPGCQTQTRGGGVASTQPAVDPVAVAADQFTVVVTALNVVRQTTDASGKSLISDDDWNNLYLPSIHAVQNALLAWESAPAGTNDAQKAEGAFLAALPSVLNLVQNAQHRAHPTTPTTRPVN